MIHCFFEQSGTFKNAAKDLGLDALDYDCVKTDHTDVISDLFVEIDRAYNCQKSIFDSVSADDICFFFFPCTYFCDMNELIFTGNQKQKPSFDVITERAYNFGIYYQTLWKLITVIKRLSLKAVIENPKSNFLSERFIKPSFIDFDRRLHGDLFKKPTYYWFFNLSPSVMGIRSLRERKSIKHINNDIGRSLISPSYARNFIASHILRIKLPGFAYQLSIDF